MDAIAPTREWQQKFGYQPPRQDQKHNQKAYRRISQAENLKNREEIDDAQFRASEKLLTHYHGAHGVRVQQDEDSDPLNTDTEYPITYHNQKLDEACKAVRSPHAWMALINMVTEGLTLVEIGTAPGRTSHPVARAYALGMITTALDALVDHWGLSTATRKPP